MRKTRKFSKIRGGSRKRRTLRVRNTISIPINWNSYDKGYRILKSKKVKNFLLKNFKKGNNLIQTQPGKPFKSYGKTILHLQAISFSSWPQKPTWSEIKCKKYKRWLKATPCSIGTNTKIFVKLKSNKKKAGFGIYLDKLIKGKINKTKHGEFVDLLQRVMGNIPIRIHNTDVYWFHL